MNAYIFNEADYLASNPDVAAAVAAGQFKSGLDHYEKCGIHERRLLGVQTRKDKVLFELDKNGLGLEIGPSHNPIASKKSGYNVHILDHLDAEGLRKKYAGHQVNLENIEEVDFVWSGQSLTELIGKSSYYDWIIASHVIEHVPDLVSFLQQCEDLLKPDAKLSLVVPDKRCCFDHFNPLSLTGSFLDAFQDRRTRPSPGQVFDHFSNASKCDDQIAWSAAIKGRLELVHSFEQAGEVWRRAGTSDDYFDVHCWRFTPESFRLVITDLNALGLIDMTIVKEFETDGCEFYATLVIRTR